MLRIIWGYKFYRSCPTSNHLYFCHYAWLSFIFLWIDIVKYTFIVCLCLKLKSLGLREKKLYLLKGTAVPRSIWTSVTAGSYGVKSLIFTKYPDMRTLSRTKRTIYVWKVLQKSSWFSRIIVLSHFTTVSFESVH